MTAHEAMFILCCLPCLLDSGVNLFVNRNQVPFFSLPNTVMKKQTFAVIDYCAPKPYSCKQFGFFLKMAKNDYTTAVLVLTCIICISLGIFLSYLLHIISKLSHVPGIYKRNFRLLYWFIVLHVIFIVGRIQYFLILVTYAYLSYILCIIMSLNCIVCSEFIFFKEFLSCNIFNCNIYYIKIMFSNIFNSNMVTFFQYGKNMIHSYLLYNILYNDFKNHILFHFFFCIKWNMKIQKCKWKHCLTNQKSEYFFIKYDTKNGSNL